MSEALLHIGSHLLRTRPALVMGIVNVTPDSFAVRCRTMDEMEIETAILRQAEEGADILDIGGYSSRPGAAVVSEEEEWRRVESALRIARRCCPQIPLSVDTFRATVAEKAIGKYGVEIINDISGGALDARMYDVVAQSGAAYVLMHMRGTPETMASMTNYADMMGEMMAYFAERADRLHQMGVSDVIIDPGWGFAKTQEQNYTLLRRMGELKELGLPLLAGISRKRMIYNVLETTPQAEETLVGTSALHMVALQNGADILRVHDVRAAKNIIKLFEQVK